MGFNYAKEKLRFNKEWDKLADEYRAAGFDEAGIQSMRDFDLNVFRQRRTFENRNQELPSESIAGDDDYSTLFQKFSALTSNFDENAFSGRYDWIEAIDNPVLARKLNALSDGDKELLTLITFDGYSQTEIAAMQGVVQSVVSRKLKRLKKHLS